MALIRRRGSTDFKDKTFLSADSALLFNGTDQYGNTHNSSSVFGILTSHSAWSVSFVLNITDTTTTSGFGGSVLSNVGSDASGLNNSFRIIIRHDSATQYTLFHETFLTASASNSVRVSLRKNRTYHITCTKAAGGGTNGFRIYVNSSPNFVVNSTSAGVQQYNVDNGGEDFFVGREYNGTQTTTFLGGSLSHLQTYNRELSEMEIRSIHQHIGYVKDGLRISGLSAFWSFQQQFIHKLVSGDNAIGGDFAIGDVVAWDSFQIVNPDRANTVTPHHLELFNFSDDEVGTGASEVATSIVGFYCPEVRYRPVGKSYVSTDQMFSEVSNFGGGDFTSVFWDDVDFTIFWSGSFQGTDTVENNSVIHFFQSAGSDYDSFSDYNQAGLFVRLTRIRLLFFEFVSGGSVAFFELALDFNFKRNRQYNIIASYNSTSRNVVFWINGRRFVPNISTTPVLVKRTTVNNNTEISRFRNSGGITFYDLTYNDLQIINRQITDQEAIIANRCSSLRAIVSNNSEVQLDLNFNKQVSNVDDLSPSNYTVLNHKNGVQPQVIVNGDETYLERKTDMPPVRECLRLLGQQYVEYDTSVLPNGTDDFVFFYSAIKDNNLIDGTENVVNYEVPFSVLNSSTGTGTTNCEAIRGFFSLRNSNVDSRLIQLGVARPGNGTGYLSPNGQINYIYSAAIVRKGGLIYLYVNGIFKPLLEAGDGHRAINPAGFPTTVFRTGYTGYLSPVENLNCNFKMINCGMYRGNGLKNWNIHELCRNLTLSNPFNWTSTQGKKFRDGLAIYHLFQRGSIYWDGSNYRCRNLGSGADATLGGYVTTGGNDFIVNNPNSIGTINSRR